MKTKMVIVAALMLLLEAHPTQGDTIWTSGHHEVIGGDIYGEIWMYNDATLDILGGDIFRLAAYDVTLTDWLAGQMDTMWAHDDSIINIHGGTLGDLWAAENSVINLYAYDVTHTTTGGRWDDGQVTGTYYSDHSSFTFDLYQDAYSHINVVPEPATILLLAFASLLSRNHLHRPFGKKRKGG
ncbi:MAG: hypothetical protein ACYS8I_01400 [Planctomycetota bacterium]|jgi:hypothetical protein